VCGPVTTVIEQASFTDESLMDTVCVLWLVLRSIFWKNTETQYCMWSDSLLDKSSCDDLVNTIELDFRGLVRPANGLPEP